MRRLSTVGAALAFAAIVIMNPASAAPSKENTDLLDRAARTIEHMKVDPAFEPAKSRMSQAKAILVIPGLVRGGFIFGGEGGTGVMMANNGGTWSDPAFYTMGAASFGLQAGLEQTEVVMLIMSEKAAQAIQNGGVKFGADVGINMVNLSSGAGVATGDVLVWTSGKGLYGGLKLNGSVVNARDDWNTTFYGRPVRPGEILSGMVKSSGPNPVRQQLAAL